MSLTHCLNGNGDLHVFLRVLDPLGQLFYLAFLSELLSLAFQGIVSFIKLRDHGLKGHGL
jgi:hypothetical protein